VPGMLARITAILAQAGANIEEVHHQRAFSALPVQSVEVEVVLQTRDRQHLAAVIGALHAQGFAAEAT
jgi:threonine dehydratase